MNQLAPRHRGRTAAVIATIILALALAGYAATRPTNSTPDNATTPASSTPAAPNGNAVPPDQAAPDAPVPAIQPDRQVMLEQLELFAETYYRVRPDDSSASRRAAVEALPFAVSDDAAASMDYTVYVNSDRDQYRINNQLTVQGTIDQSAAQVASEQQEGRLLYMSVPVTIITNWPDGRTQEVQVHRLGTVWQHQPDGTWMMTAFGDDGGFQ